MQKDSCLHELLETKQRKHSQHFYSSEDLYAKEEKFTHFRAICMQMFYADLLFKMQILNSAFLLQGKHKAIEERMQMTIAIQLHCKTRSEEMHMVLQY